MMWKTYKKKHNLVWAGMACVLLIYGGLTAEIWAYSTGFPILLISLHELFYHKGEK